MSCNHKVRRVQSCVWRLQNINPPPPLLLASVSSPRTKGGGSHSPGGEGDGGGGRSIFWKTPAIGFVSYNNLYSAATIDFSHPIQLLPIFTLPLLRKTQSIFPEKSLHFNTCPFHLKLRTPHTVTCFVVGKYLRWFNIQHAYICTS